jgi:hypothetical protein
MPSNISIVSSLFQNIRWFFTCVSVVSLVCRGTDVSIENMHQGFTHVFESTFESTEGVKEYIEHPAHVEYANEVLPLMEKVLIIDYKPAAGKA